MNTRVFAVLLLCTALALPAFSQSSSQPADQTAASQVVTATGREPLQTKHTDFWDGDEPSLTWLVLHPFASKGYVQRHLDAIHDRVNELDQLTTSNSQQIKDVDSRAQHGIQLASTKTEEAEQHATDASTKATAAQQTATDANTNVAKVQTVVDGLDKFQASNQTVIRFRPGQTMLSKQAKEALDDMAGRLKDQHGYVIEVQGFASGHGQPAIAASQRMADSVQRYLVLNHEIPAFRIYVVGMGNAAVASETGSKPVSRNRVEVNVLKNGLDQMAASDSTAK